MEAGGRPEELVGEGMEAGGRPEVSGRKAEALPPVVWVRRAELRSVGEETAAEVLQEVLVHTAAA